MKCAGCGKEIAQTAHYCDHCGARQPGPAARMAQMGGEAVEAAAAASVSTSSPRRGGSIAFVIGTVLAVALVAVAAWRVLDHGSGPLETRTTGEAPASVPSGAVPPPADQSAAPLPPAEPLPPLDSGNPAEEGGGTSATAGSETSTMEESSAPAGVPATPAAAGERPAGAAKGAASRAHGATATKAAKPARPATAATTSVAPGSSASPTANAAQAPTPAPAPAPANEHWARMEEDMAKCTREDFINRVICAQRVKYRYCPGYWGKVPQCPGSPASEHE